MMAWELTGVAAARTASRAPKWSAVFMARTRLGRLAKCVKLPLSIYEADRDQAKAYAQDHQDELLRW